MTNQKQVLQIMRAIWSSRTAEQIKGCERMLKNYSHRVKGDNIGITLIEVEIERQKLQFQIYNY